MADYTDQQLIEIARKLRQWANESGFQQISVSNIDLAEHERHLHHWLDAGFHGEMAYMAEHGTKRSRPDELVPGTITVISVRMEYDPPDVTPTEQVLANSHKAFVSRYALGRDYHKVIRRRLQKLADKLESLVGKFGYRVFTDSAPVLEKALAEKAGLGWIGKHSNLINQKAGSWFFLGEILTDLPLPTMDSPEVNHCGTCTSCIDACPTDAIVAPYQVDARRCISYLTIELKGPIPLEFRKAMGNRIYGCDDCQLVCPWNRFSQHTSEPDFFVRHHLDNADLLDLFNWDEETFLKNTEGSPIRRIGYQRWLRNIAVGMGNMDTSDNVLDALNNKLADEHITELVREHINWALQQHQSP